MNSAFDVMFSQTAQLMRKSIELDEDAHARNVTWQAILIRCNLQALTFDEKNQFSEGEYKKAEYEGYFKEQDNAREGDRIVAPPELGGEIYEIIGIIDELRIGDVRIGRIGLLRRVGQVTNSETSDSNLKFSIELP